MTTTTTATPQRKTARNRVDDRAVIATVKQDAMRAKPGKAFRNPARHETTCPVCKGGSRAAVDQAFASGQSLTECAKLAGVTEGEVEHHAIYFDLLTDRYATTLPTLRRFLLRGESVGRSSKAAWVTAAAFIKALELHARLNGELSDVPAEVNVMVQNLPAEYRQQVQEALETRDPERLAQLAGRAEAVVADA